MKRISILVLVIAIILTAAYTAITLYDDNLKVGRMWETPAVRPHEQAPHVMKSGVIPIDGGEILYKNSRGEDLKSPFESDDPQVITSGKSLYFTYCAQCHGNHFDGNGTVGQSFHPLPANLRTKKVQELPEGVLFKSISYGVLGGRQPPLATTIDVADRWQIIAFLKSLPPRN